MSLPDWLFPHITPNGVSEFTFMRTLLDYYERSDKSGWGLLFAIYNTCDYHDLSYEALQNFEHVWWIQNKLHESINVISSRDVNFLIYSYFGPMEQTQ